MIIIGYICC